MPLSNEHIKKNDALAEELLDVGTRMLLAITQAGIPLNTPVNILALQLFGPVFALAMGTDPRKNTDDLIAIAELLDIDKVKALLGDVIK